MHSIVRLTLVAATLAASAGAAHAALQINTPFVNFETRAYNSLGYAQGSFLRFGANGVSDTATGNAAGITGLATNSASGLQYGIFYNPGPTIPNFFSRQLSVGPSGVPPAYYAPWNLNFSKGADSIARTVDLPDSARPIGFVSSITLSGTAELPRFTWTPPANDTVQGYRVNIYDRSIISTVPGRLNNGQVVSVNLTGTSYQVNQADFVNGYTLKAGTSYAIEIAALQIREGSGSTSLTNNNLQAVSRVYADFTPVAGNAQQIQLPVVTIDGSYKFDFAVQAGVTYHIDPLVAVGYDYQIGDGDPNFRSVSLPTGIGDGEYDLWLWNGADWWLVADNWLGGSTFDFGIAGVDRFRVTDIETAAGLDPADVTAFVTSVSFVADGQFTGTQTPITVEVAGQVPEPPIGALLFTGIAALVLLRPGRWRGRLRG